MKTARARVAPRHRPLRAAPSSAAALAGALHSPSLIPLGLLALRPAPHSCPHPRDQSGVRRSCRPARWRPAGWPWRVSGIADAGRRQGHRRCRLGGRVGGHARATLSRPAPRTVRREYSLRCRPSLGALRQAVAAPSCPSRQRSSGGRRAVVAPPVLAAATAAAAPLPTPSAVWPVRSTRWGGGGCLCVGRSWAQDASQRALTCRAAPPAPSLAPRRAPSPAPSWRPWALAWRCASWCRCRWA